MLLLGGSSSHSRGMMEEHPAIRVPIANNYQAPMASEPPQANELATYAKSLSEMSQRLSGLEIPRPSRDNPPDNFVIAWIHISLAVCHWNTDDMTAFDHHLESFAQKIAAAWPKFLKSFQDRPLEERAAAMPLSILSLLTQELLMDFTGMRPDVMASYWDYYNQLASISLSYRFQLHDRLKQ